MRLGGGDADGCGSGSRSRTPARVSATANADTPHADDAEPLLAPDPAAEHPGGRPAAPTLLVRDHPRALREAPRRRPGSDAIVKSAVSSESTPGVLVTATPRACAAAISILSTPFPKLRDAGFNLRPGVRRGASASMTGRSRSAPARSASRERRRRVRRALMARSSCVLMPRAEQLAHPVLRSAGAGGGSRSRCGFCIGACLASSFTQCRGCRVTDLYPPLSMLRPDGTRADVQSQRRADAARRIVPERLPSRPVRRHARCRHRRRELRRMRGAGCA